MVSYIDKLQEPNGLFHHAADVPFFWGRGNGWFAAGMAEMLRDLPADHPQRARIFAGYKKMMAALLQYQGKDGMWRQLIDHDDIWPESSASAMFSFALITCVKNGWLPGETYGPAARKAWIAVVRRYGEEERYGVLLRAEAPDRRSPCAGAGVVGCFGVAAVRPTAKVEVTRTFYR
jgi:rhamnogalacturonyl hydrolase YesR